MRQVSDKIARVESAVLIVLVALIAAILLAGTLARAAGHPLTGADEAAVMAMAWTGFIGASLAVHEQAHMAIRLWPEGARPGLRLWLDRAARLVAAVFWVGLAILLWRWFDPVGLIRAGGADALAATRFNYLYTEPTQTIGLRKFWFWLVLPISTATALVHLAAGWK